MDDVGVTDITEDGVTGVGGITVVGGVTDIGGVKEWSFITGRGRGSGN